MADRSAWTRRGNGKMMVVKGGTVEDRAPPFRSRPTTSYIIPLSLFFPFFVPWMTAVGGHCLQRVYRGPRLIFF